MEEFEVEQPEPPKEPLILDDQFILNVPENIAAAMKEAIHSGSGTFKDRCRLKIENDMRHGTFFFDDASLYVKIVDLPCVIESLKTIDRKNVYKTADICQMAMCTVEEQAEEEPKPAKKKDAFKVEKKYLYPHGITPPLKNVRKRRFRKILKKKQYSDQPEIEKEVRRLLRMDYEAHHVSWEVIDEEEDKNREGGGKDVLMQGSKTNENPPTSGSASRIAEELFGDALSDSEADDEDGAGGDDESRLSLDLDNSQSQSGQSESVTFGHQDNKEKYGTSFTTDMFHSPNSSGSSSQRTPEKSRSHGHKARHSSGASYSSLSKDDLESQLSVLRNQLTEVSARRQIQEVELSTMENMSLRQRLETVLKKHQDEEEEKRREISEVEDLLKQFSM